MTPDELADVYAATGAALWHLQFLEDVLVTYVTMRLHVKPTMPVAEAHAILARERRRTLGTLLKAATQGGMLVDEVAEGFRLLLDERNWLVHRVVQEYADALHRSDVRAALVARIRGLNDRAIELKESLFEQARAWCTSHGVDLGRADGLALARFEKLRGA